MKRTPFLLLPLIVGALLPIGGCVDESTQPVAFDQVLESATFDNRLFTPIIVYRDNVVLDTLPARVERTYRIDRKGIVRHQWRILSPRDIQGNPYGIEPFGDFGPQYDINADYRITNSVDGREIFTPRLANFSFDRFRFFYANFRERDQFLVGLVLQPNMVLSLEHAPYYYWNSESNVYLDNIDFFNEEFLISRTDTNAFGEPLLRMSDDSRFSDGGATEPITLN